MLYEFFDSGQLALIMGNDPPPYLLQAVFLYHATIEKIQNKKRELELKNG